MAARPRATAAGSQTAVPHHRLQAQQGPHSGQGRDHRVRPEPLVPHRAVALRRRREALHPRAQRREGRRLRRVRPEGRHPYRQLAADALHPDGLDRAQRGDSPRRWRQDGSQRRHERPARRQRRRLCHTAPSLNRDASRADRLSRHTRHRRQLRARAHQSRQGRPEPLEGHSPPDPRCRHEPRRPPARWWRRQDQRWTSPGLPWGQPEGRTRLPKPSDSLIIRRRRGRGARR